MGAWIIKLWIVALFGVSVSGGKVFVGLDFYSERYIMHHKYIIRSAKNCTSNNDCLEPDTYCDMNIHLCLCKRDYVSNAAGTKCIKLPKELGKDACAEDEQCRAAFGVKALCLRSVCQCCEKCRFAEYTCHSVVGLGERCNTKHNCPIYEVTAAAANYSFCDGGFCKCPWGLQLSPDKKTCLIKAKLNDDCSIDDECIINNTICDNKCICDRDYVSSSDNTTCLNTAFSLGEKCVEDIQCSTYLPHSECKDGFCTCTFNFHRRGALCIKDVALNHSCENHNECITPSNKNSISTAVTNVGCYNRTCQCSPNYKFVEESCDCIGYTELSNSVMSCEVSRLLTTVILISTLLVV